MAAASSPRAAAIDPSIALTLLSWMRRLEGRPVSSRLRTGARTALVATCAIGLVGLVPEVSQALGAT